MLKTKVSFFFRYKQSTLYIIPFSKMFNLKINKLIYKQREYVKLKVKKLLNLLLWTTHMNTQLST